MPTRDELLNSIANTVADYRQDDIPAITPEHVDTWVSQFDEEDQLIILQEMDKILLNYYMSRAKARELLSNLLGHYEIFGEDPETTLRQTKFLSIQQRGSSQEELLYLVEEIIQDEYGLTLDDCGEEPSQYVYLDDGLFSGTKVRYDCQDWLPEAIEGTTIHFIFFATHSHGLNYFKQKFDESARRRNVTRKCWSFLKLENKPWETQKFECFWPREVKGDELVDEYIALLHQRCQGQRYTPRIFRPNNIPRRETVFSSPEARDIIERAFLKAGAYIVSLPENPHHSMRPLGYEYLESLGFGSLFISYRNIPNNCPLALWWGDPDMPSSHPLSHWYPLFPRKTNNPHFEDEWDLF